MLWAMCIAIRWFNMFALYMYLQVICSLCETEQDVSSAFIQELDSLIVKFASVF